MLAEAAGYGSQLVVFPEAFVGGYPRGSNFGVAIGNRTAKGKEDFRKYHAAAIDVPGKTTFWFSFWWFDALVMCTEIGWPHQNARVIEYCIEIQPVQWPVSLCLNCKLTIGYY